MDNGSLAPPVQERFLIFLSSNQMVHLECPSSTGSQASSMIRASAHPSSTLVCLSLILSKLFLYMIYATNIPIKIKKIPITFFFPIFSFNSILPKIATHIYPVASSSGPTDNGTIL